MCAAGECLRTGPLTRGMCAMHYQRWRRYGRVNRVNAGDPEVEHAARLKAILIRHRPNNDAERLRATIDHAHMQAAARIVELEAILSALPEGERGVLRSKILSHLES